MNLRNPTFETTYYIFYLPFIHLQENRVSNEDTKAPTSSSIKGSTTTSTAQYSCLDALWSLLQRWESLLLHHHRDNASPFILAKAMQVIAALWQSGGPAYRAICVLQRQPGFWAVIIGILEQTGAAATATAAGQSGGTSFLDSLLDQETGGDATSTAENGFAAAEKWIGMKTECWKIVAEMAAMQVLAAEFFVWLNTANSNVAAATVSSVSHHTMPPELYEFVVQGKLQALVPRLLERYCLVLPNITGLESDTARLATATAAQLIEISIHDHALWASVQAGPSLVSKLASITELELHNCNDQAQVAAGLHSIAAAALGAAGDQAVRSRPALRALANYLLTQAEIPQRLAPIAHYGSKYIYDSSLLRRRIGTALAQETPLLNDLKNCLGAVSVAYALEDVRADAATALDALVAVADAAAAAQPAETKNEETKAVIVEHVATMLSRVIESLLTAPITTTRSTGVIRGNDCGGSFLRSLHLASAAAAAQVALVIVRPKRFENRSSPLHTRTASSPFAAGASPPGATVHLPSTTPTPAAAFAAVSPLVVESTLSLAAKWFETSGSLAIPTTGSGNEMSERELVDSISKCLLAAALHSVSSTTISLSSFASSTSREGPAQHAAQRLLPALLNIISGNLNTNDVKHAEAAASLCAALLDRLVPQDVWLPVLRHHFHFGRALGTALEAMNRAASGAVTSTELQVNTHGAILEALLLLALQVTQTSAGAELLIEQGVPPLFLSLAAWLQAPPPGGNLLGLATSTPTANINIMATTTPAPAPLMFSVTTPSTTMMMPPPPPPPPPSSMSQMMVVDYSNAYSIMEGSFFTTLPHRVWCTALSLMGLLLAASPGTPSVVSPGLQLLVGMDPRIQLALEPPEGNARQPVTLAMAQESRYALFLLYGVVKTARGQYRMALPHALPALRRASASLLRFLATMEAENGSGGGNSDENVVCVAVTDHEKSLMKAPAPSTALSGGWFGAEACCTTNAHGSSTMTYPTGGRSSSSSSTAYLQNLEGVGRLNGFTWELAEQLYSCAQYALAFHIAVAPEVSEAEAENLGPEWPDATTLTTLCERCIEIIDPACAGNAAAQPAVRRILKTMISILNSSLQLLHVMVPQGEAAAKMVRALMRESEAAVERAHAILATYSL